MGVTFFAALAERPSCTANACNGGRKDCPCPQACHLPLAPARAVGLRALAWTYVAVGLFLAVLLSYGLAPGGEKDSAAASALTVAAGASR